MVSVPWVHDKSLQHKCPTLCDPIDLAHQMPLSVGLSSQEYWSGLLCPPPGDLPGPVIKSRSSVSHALALGFLPQAPPR